MTVATGDILVEDWLHGYNDDLSITAGFAKDIADVIHWARKVAATTQFRHATDEDVYLLAALTRLDERANDGNR